MSVDDGAFRTTTTAMKIRSVTLVALTVFASAPAARSDASRYEIKPDVVYGHKLGMALTMDVVRPKAGANGAGVLFMVSGGWVSGWIPPENAVGGDSGRALGFTQLLDKGFTLFLVRHGSSPRFKVPECIDDVRRAVRFVRGHAADWAVDQERLGVFGASAGGHLSLMLGTTGDDGRPDSRDAVDRTGNRVAAVVAIFPPSELKSFLESEDMRRQFPALQFDAGEWKSVSPLEHVSSDDPPTLLFHGGKDTLVPDKHSREMLSALKEKGVPAEFVFFPEAGHGFSGEDRERVAAATVTWFEKHLASPKEFNLAGAWSARAGLPDGGEFLSTITFNKSGDTWNGTSDSERGHRALDRIKLDGRKLNVEIDIERDGETALIRVKAEAESAAKLTGTWAMLRPSGEEVASGRWEAAREMKKAESGPLVGEWEMELKMNDETRDYTLKFESKDGKLAGFLISPRSGEHPAESTSLENQDFKMRVKRDFNGTPVTLVYTGKLDAGSLAGKVVIEGFEDQASGEWQAKKK